MIQKKMKWIGGAVVAVCVLAISATWPHAQGTIFLKPSTAINGEPQPKAALVRMHVVGSNRDHLLVHSLTGTVRARYETPIGFRVNGKITKRHVDLGQKVESGQILFELDPSDLELQRKAAAANLDVSHAVMRQAITEEKRLAELRRSKAISQSEYDLALSARDRAVGQHSNAQRHLELADNQLTYCNVFSDEAGVVTSVDAEAGQVVAIGARVCSIASTHELETVVDIPENRVSMFQPTDVEVRFWSLKDVVTRAHLRELSPIADPVIRTFRAKFTLLAPPPQVQLGMTSSVYWEESDSSKEMRIPATSIFQRHEKPCVWLVHSDAGPSSTRSIEAREIDLVGLGDGYAKISAGLEPGQTIVSSGVHKLDASIRVRSWQVPND